MLKPGVSEAAALPPPGQPPPSLTLLGSSFIFSQGSYHAEVCLLALTSGFLKAELCHRPHRWICQAPSQSGKDSRSDFLK